MRMRMVLGYAGGFTDAVAKLVGADNSVIVADLVSCPGLGTVGLVCVPRISSAALTSRVALPAIQP
jgi:hypothetical protein